MIGSAGLAPPMGFDLYTYARQIEWMIVGGAGDLRATCLEMGPCHMPSRAISWPKENRRVGAKPGHTAGAIASMEASTYIDRHVYQSKAVGLAELKR